MAGGVVKGIRIEKEEVASLGCTHGEIIGYAPNPMLFALATTRTPGNDLRTAATLPSLEALSTSRISEGISFNASATTERHFSVISRVL